MAHHKDFRVREGEEVNLKEWPTHVKHGQGSKDDLQALLTQHVVRLSGQQQLLYAANR